MLQSELADVAFATLKMMHLWMRGKLAMPPLSLEEASAVGRHLCLL